MRLAIPGVPDLSAKAQRELGRIEAAMGAVLDAAGFLSVVPPVLELAEPFIETSGEDIRARLYSFTDPSGIEYCLRPDLTIPTCRQFLRQNDHPRAEARLQVIGPAFRHQIPGSIRPRQFQQLGAELINAIDPVAADGEMMALAAQCLSAVGISQFSIRFGDLGLFADLMRGLDIPARVQARLRRGLGAPQAMDKLLNDNPAQARPQSALTDILSGLAPGKARQLIDEILNLSGIQPVGGRGVDEIVDRLMNQSADRSSPMPGTKAAEFIRQYLALSGPVAQMIPEIEKLFQPLGLDLGGFRRRLDHLNRRGIDVNRLIFAGGFSRSIDYYTGLVFEMTADQDLSGDLGPLAAGGRYDGLLARLGAAEDLPAIGFAIWPERVMTIAGKVV